jgi:cytochrome c peroxidase
LQFVEHWRGDRENVEDQASKALIGSASFGQPDYSAAMAKLEAIGYGPMFQAAFPDQKNPITPQNWGKAIGAYERTLVTPSPFDAYLQGDTKALSPAAQVGLRKFIDTGCATCHNGVGVGGSIYQKFGLLKDYWQATDSQQIDKGRFEVTQNPADTYVFKVPSLRNVAMTPPYFHDGSVASLAQAVAVMADVQLGKSLTDEDIKEITAFLHSLTGPLPEQFATVPTLPAAAFSQTKP